MKDEEKQSTPTQRSYGRGMIDGLRLAGVENPEELMNIARLRQIEQGLNGTTRKVYDVIDYTKAMTFPQICAAIVGAGTRCDNRVLRACLGELYEKGLVRSGAGKDTFQRVAPRLAPTTAAPPVTTTATATPIETSNSALAPAPSPAPVEVAPPFEKLATIELRLRSLISELSVIASDLATTALETEAFLDKIRKDHEKVAKLKELLTSL